MKSEDNEKFKTKTFTLFTAEKPRAREIEDIEIFAKSLPMTLFHVVFKKGGENRREIANRCYNAGIGDVIEQSPDYDDPSVVAGVSKFHLLLPHKAIWAAKDEDEELAEQADFETRLCHSIAASEEFTLPPESDYGALQYLEIKQSYEKELYRAYDYAIRSKNLKIKPFTRYLDRFLKVWTNKGIVFDLRPSEREQIEAAAREKS